MSALAGRLVDWTAAPCAEDVVAAADDQGGVGVWKARAPLISFSAHESACANVCFHPTVAGVLASSADTGADSGQVSLWNISSGTASRFWGASVGHGAASIAFRGDGQLLAASTHAGVCAIYDPRAPALAGHAPVGSTPAVYAPGRPTRVLWMGERPFVLTTGMAKTRERSAALWDQRDLSRPLATLQMQPSTKPLVPLYDEDTQLAYLAERGDTTLRWVDADPSSARPLAELGAVLLPAPISGCALLPKPQLRVMSGEIARIHVLLANVGAGQGAAVVPIAHVAPRRTYLDFHSDLFPDTRAPLPAQSFEQGDVRPDSNRSKVLAHWKRHNRRAAAPAVDHARFKYLVGRADRPSATFTNLRNINTSLSQQSDPVKVGSKYIAISCSGAGGQVGILGRDSPGRVPDRLATVVHGADIADTAFDPFDPTIIATAGVDGRLQLWRIPDAELGANTSFELEEHLRVAADRIHQIRFHPCAKGVVAVLASSAGEHAVYVYNGLTPLFAVAKTDEGLHTFEWSPDGSRIAVATKESKQLRVYDVRSQELLAKGPAMDSSRGCRVAWLGRSRICLSGFGHKGRRQFAIYDAESLYEPLDRVDVDASPGLLVPIADADCNVVYLDDRGSRLTHAYEVVGDRLVELPKVESLHPSLGMAALPKRYANVAQCELLRVYRLSAQALEPLGFRVPRKRPEYFQDDIFPDTADTETPSVDTLAWLGGAKPEPVLISLQPQGMTPLSAAPPEAARKRVASAEPKPLVDNTKVAISAMLSRVEGSDDKAQNNDEPGSGSDWDD
ncbi:hypothetical protein LPJ61_000589 [Coemansia biformis]|uniref:DUF1899 domain-containing protein n=1 Tax=Coemansia biformis TaxID=1286918 RepID=A0A9W7YID2_9FUNG|nr:hypothetical protein LPJ61_000589 [Coemansia biformis]